MATSADVETEHFTPESMFIAQTQRNREGRELKQRLEMHVLLSNYSPLFSLPVIDHNA